MLVLDSDHLSIWHRATGSEFRRLDARLSRVPASEWAATIVGFEEQTRGWMAFVARARSMPEQIEAYRRLKDHLSDYAGIEVLAFDDRAAVEYQRLRSLKLRIGTMDLKIAAIALSRDAVLLSRNMSDFRKVPKLKVEDRTV